MAVQPQLRKIEGGWDFGTGMCKTHGEALPQGMTYCWRCLAREVDPPDLHKVSAWWSASELKVDCPVCGREARQTSFFMGMCSICWCRHDATVRDKLRG